MSPVIWHGRYFTTLCPFHDDNSPSFLVYANGGVCLSASCQRKASLNEIFTKITHQPVVSKITFANNRLVDWELIPDLERLCSEAHGYMLANPGMDTYLRLRGLEEAIRPCQLGWWHGWITIPIYSNSGHAFKGCVLRATPDLQKATGARYIMPPRQPRLLYPPRVLAINNVLETRGTVYVVFGIFDAIALSLIGLTAVTSTNITGFRPIDLQEYRCKLVVVPDRGEETKGRQMVAGLDWRGEFKSLPYDDTHKDPADFVQHGQSGWLRTILTH